MNSKDIFRESTQRRVNMAYLGFFSVYTFLRHCEAQLEVPLRSIQLKDAASPKKSLQHLVSSRYLRHVDDQSTPAVEDSSQSPGSEFAANSEPGDCFVAATLQNSANTAHFWIVHKNAPSPFLRTRNDKLRRNSASAIVQTQNFGMTHIEQQTRLV